MTRTERRWLSFWSLVVMTALTMAPAAKAMQAAAEAGAMTPKKAPTSLGKAVTGVQQGAAQALGSAAPVAGATGAPEAAGEQAAPQEGFPEGSVPLRVLAGKSILVNTTDRLKRVAVSDPTIADALVVTPTQILVHGRQPGEVSLVLWDEAERSRSFDLRVDVDATSAAEEIRRIFPNERIDVSASRSAIVLSGHVSSEEIQKHAGLLASAYSKSVVNVLTFGPYEPQEVLLQVKFAEVNRQALERYGVNLFSTNSGLIGETGTGQAGARQAINLNDVDVKDQPEGSFESNLRIDPLNVFLFRPDIHLGAAIQALKQKQLAQILAEPNLIALNGKEASFLAGGEFPIPIVQGGGNVGNVTVQFKEFGVRLKFTPYIMPTGNIRLKVAPEVSQLDFANGVTISGFTIPALVTRRAETELELQDGQSFLIAGLIDNRVAQTVAKIPGLGDIPIIGYLFRSKFNQKDTGELMVLVTARKVSPSTELPPGPQFPQEWLDKQKFDKPKGGGK